MIVLDATTKSLEIVLAGAITTNQLPFVATYVDVTATAYTPTENDGVSNSTTAVTLVAAPSVSTQRQVKFLSVYNADTAAATVTVRYNNNSTTRTIVKVVLTVGYHLVYTDGEGWRVYDTNGSLVSASSGTAPNDEDYLVKTASADLSAERVVTDGTSITADWSVAGQVTLKRAALTGDVTASADANATTIANDAVTNAKLADMAQSTFKMRAAGAGTGDPIDGTIAQAKTALAIDHGADVTGLTDDDHTQYALLAGRSGGQTITGGTASGDDLTLKTTSNATKGTLFVEEADAVELVSGTTAMELRLREPSGSGANYTALKAQAQAGNVTYTLPAADGSSGQNLQTNGSGTLSWATAASGGGLEQAFRGLHLRTSPNADVAATTVTLLRCDAMVMDDGTYVEDWDDLSAIISSAGAGGLDTGAEAASTWYEVYAIRKSSDGTKNLLLHRAKDYFLDESQTAASDIAYELREGATTNVKVGQTFDTDEAGLLEFVDFQVDQQVTVSGRVWVELYATSAGAPTGAALATSDKLDASQVDDNTYIVRFAFRAPYTLVAGTTYAVALVGDYTASATVNIRVLANSLGGYGAGSTYLYDGTNWSSAATDLWFKVYVTRNDTAVTMPTGYDQKCKVGFVYNDSGSNFNPFVQVNRTWRTLESISVGNITATSPTLTAIDTAVPPIPLVVELAANNSTSGSRTYIGGIPDGFRVGDDNYGSNGIWTVIGAATLSNDWFRGNIITEFQAIYISVNANTGQAQVGGFTW